MRLTKKIEKDDFGCEYDLINCHENIMYANTIRINKLGQLEDIEEEFGIDLATLLKALINEYIFIKQDNEIYENNVEFSFNKDEKGWYINLEVCHFDKLYFKDYGKTWALTREELE